MEALHTFLPFGKEVSLRLFWTLLLLCRCWGQCLAFHSLKQNAPHDLKLRYSDVKLQNVLQVLGDETPDQDILHNALMRQGLAGDGGGAVLQQPGLQSSPLIGEPISSYDRVLHDALQVPDKHSRQQVTSICSWLKIHVSCAEVGSQQRCAKTHAKMLCQFGRRIRSLL